MDLSNLRIVVQSHSMLPHQNIHLKAMESGLRKHGAKPEIVPRGTLVKCDIATIWGWKPAAFMRSLLKQGTNVLLMERGYFPDRFQWTSLGWNGLNNRALPQPCLDNGERFRENWPELLKPWMDQAGYALLCGQVPGDASLNGIDCEPWAQKVTDSLIAMGHSVKFRPHPLLIRRNNVRVPQGAECEVGPSLYQDLERAAFCVTFNSNSAVESVCFGTPTVTLDEGAAAWPVSSHTLESIMTPERTEWANALAWKQWKINQISDGSALEAIWQTLPVAAA